MYVSSQNPSGDARPLACLTSEGFKKSSTWMVIAGRSRISATKLAAKDVLPVSASTFPYVHSPRLGPSPPTARERSKGHYSRGRNEDEGCWWIAEINGDSTAALNDTPAPESQTVNGCPVGHIQPLGGGAFFRPLTDWTNAYTRHD